MDQPEYCLAEEAALFGGPELLECDKASGWLHKKLRTLDDLRPIDLIRTNAGDRLVEDALMRIAWAPRPTAANRSAGWGSLARDSIRCADDALRCRKQFRACAAIYNCIAHCRQALPLRYARQQYRHAFASVCAEPACRLTRQLATMKFKAFRTSLRKDLRLFLPLALSPPFRRQ